MISIFYNRFKAMLNVYSNSIQKDTHKLILLQGQGLAERHSLKSQIKGLHEVEFSAFSQWGEDGILDWMIEQIPDIPESFIEFGVENYYESNTRFLLQNRNWTGLVMDGSSDNIDQICKSQIYWRYQIKAVCGFVTRDNINRLIQDNGFVGEIGLLSIDIDGNDYWVWDAIEVVNPAIVVCEYNAVFGDCCRITIPYDPDFVRAKVHHSNLYFGASLPALIDLGKRKGYVFVGTGSSGCNAFFVHERYYEVMLNKPEGAWAFPSKFREGRGLDGSLTFVSGTDRLHEIKNMEVIDLDNNAKRQLELLQGLYSEEWARGFERKL